MDDDGSLERSSARPRSRSRSRSRSRQRSRSRRRRRIRRRRVLLSRRRSVERTNERINPKNPITPSAPEFHAHVHGPGAPPPPLSHRRVTIGHRVSIRLSVRPLDVDDRPDRPIDRPDRPDPTDRPDRSTDRRSVRARPRPPRTPTPPHPPARVPRPDARGEGPVDRSRKNRSIEKKPIDRSIDRPDGSIDRSTPPVVVVVGLPSAKKKRTHGRRDAFSTTRARREW